MKLEKKLLEEINRYKAINKYVKEQTAPAAAPPSPTDDEQMQPADASTSGTDGSLPPAPTDSGVPPADNGTPPPPAESTTPPPMAEDLPETGGNEQKLDVTELVNMTKELKSKMEQESNKNQDAVHKMDGIFSKLDDLANQLSQMDSLVSKIDDLEKKVSEIKPLTPEEKLNLRSYDSYPFNQKLSDFFKDKQPEMELTRKNEYVLEPEDVQDYNKDEVENSFNDLGNNLNNALNKFR